MKKLLVYGPNGTGTSTTVRILNACEDIFCLYENAGEPFTKYGSRLFDSLPDLRKTINCSSSLERLDLINKSLKNRGQNFSWIGLKKPFLGIKEFFDLNPSKFDKRIYCYRHICEWIVKEKIQKSLRTDVDIFQPMLFYIYSLALSKQIPNTYYLYLNRFLKESDTVCLEIYQFLELKQPASPYFEFIGFEKFPKNVESFGHYSSKIKPNKNDTNFVLKSKLPDPINQIIELFYLVSSNKVINYSPILDELNEMVKLDVQFKFEDIFEDFFTHRFSRYSTQNKKKSKSQKIIGKIKKKIPKRIKTKIKELIY